MKVGAVLLAGGRDRGPLAEATGQPIRGLIPVAGRPMIAYVLDALAGASCIGPVVVVGPEDLGKAVAGARLLPEGPDLLANIVAGLGALSSDVSSDGPALLLTVDIPFLTSAAVDDFVRRALETEADLCYPIIRQEVSESRFPGMKRTYVRLREGRVTGGNMMLVRTGFFRRMEPLVARAYAARKRPVELARMVGLGLLVRLLLGRLAVAHVEARVGRILGGTVRAVVTEHAEIGADVDKPDDLRVAEASLGANGDAHS